MTNYVGVFAPIANPATISLLSTPQVGQGSGVINFTVSVQNLSSVTTVLLNLTYNSSPQNLAATNMYINNTQDFPNLSATTVINAGGGFELINISCTNIGHD